MYEFHFYFINVLQLQVNSALRLLEDLILGTYSRIVHIKLAYCK